jgi:hypothetical protein
MAQSFGETTLGNLYKDMGYESATDIVEGWVAGIGDWNNPDSLLGKSAEALNNYSNSINAIFNIAGTSV